MAKRKPCVEVLAEQLCETLEALKETLFSEINTSNEGVSEFIKENESQFVGFVEDLFRVVVPPIFEVSTELEVETRKFTSLPSLDEGGSLGQFCSIRSG